MEHSENLSVPDTRTATSGKRALITGITGQDGSYLAEHLLTQGYDVIGLERRVALLDPAARHARVAHLLDRITLAPGSLEDYTSLVRVLEQYPFDEVYHLAAQSFVTLSFEDEFSTMHTNLTGTHNLLAAVRRHCPSARFYFAASSEMYGKVVESPQTELTPFHPRSPYGVSKVAGYFLTVNYREAYNMFCCNGILFNHESPRRGMEFVTRKITNGVARIKLGLASELRLGNLQAKRDWGHARDYVRAMHLMLQQTVPDDYVIATGETRTVGEFCEVAFAEAGLDYRDHVAVDPALFRPAEVDLLIGDASKARKTLGWKPTCGFASLVREMVQSELEAMSGVRNNAEAVCADAA
jgi:GDPmannose 4,6-dehydratase